MSSRSLRMKKTGNWHNDFVTALKGCTEITITGVAACADVTCGNVIDTCDPLPNTKADDAMSMDSSIDLDRPQRSMKSSSRSRNSHSDKSVSVASLKGLGAEGRDECHERLEIEATFNDNGLECSKHKRTTAGIFSGRNKGQQRAQIRGRDGEREGVMRSKPRNKTPSRRSKLQAGSWMEQVKTKLNLDEVETQQPKTKPLKFLQKNGELQPTFNQ